MKVDILTATDRPMDVIAIAAGTSTDHMSPNHKRVKMCFDRGHMSVFEQANATFLIEGISRACSHQLVRHRLASFVQLSQRYTKTTDDDWYVTPPSMEGSWYYRCAMEDAMSHYQQALERDIKPEDARFMLPEATKTKVTMLMNVRELFHFFNLRLDHAAQWEIRELADEMRKMLYRRDRQWRQLMMLWEGES